MVFGKFCAFIYFLMLLATLEGAAVADSVDDVNPFIGVDGTATADGGDVFPGAAVPFGMLKAGPDMLGDNGGAGWKSNFEIDGFSQTHVTGTGGGPEYGNILVATTTGDMRAHGLSSPYKDETASPGYFHVHLTRYDIDVDIAAARRCALYRLTYPRSSKANLIVDAGHILSDGAEWTNPSSPQGEDQRLEASEISIISPTEMSGSTTVSGGWNKQTRPYTVYFYAVTDTPASAWGTWTGGRLTPGSRHADETIGLGTAAWLSFPTQDHQVVQLRLAISFISVAQARVSLIEEMPRSDYDEVRTAAHAAWKAALAPIEVEGASASQRTALYTALYHSMLMPTERSGENPLWASTEPSYDDFYAIWDIFRTTSPLLALIAPRRQADIVRALIDIYRHEGWLPDARKGNFSGMTQGGSNADVMIADALARGLTGIDWPTAYAAVVKDAEMPTPDPMRVGRRGVSDYKALGYVSVESSDLQGSRQVEYCFDDYVIAQMAAAFGHTRDALTYRRRSDNWRKLWDLNARSDGFKGFIRPRHRDGAWQEPFDPVHASSWGYDGFYEDTSWAYSFDVPQDIAGVIKTMGGRREFVRRLDRFFAVPRRYYVGNEPAFLIPYLYIWAGRHDLTAARVRSTLVNFFNTSRSGLPGNDDSGAMSSWFTLGLLGIYPIAGTDIWLIGSPGVARTILHLADGAQFVIASPATSAQNQYVTAASLNGHALDRAWLHHAEIARGGILELTMSPHPSTWPQGPPPPSSSDRNSNNKGF